MLVTGTAIWIKLEPSKGYWVYMKEAANLTINGYAPDKNISLDSGWNLIGWPSNETTQVIEALASINNSYDKVFTYDQNGGWEYMAYYDGTWYGYLDVMKPGKGYWIYMEEAGSLQVP